MKGLLKLKKWKREIPTGEEIQKISLSGNLKIYIGKSCKRDEEKEEAFSIFCSTRI